MEGLRTRGLLRPIDSQGVSTRHMEHPSGGFKAQAAIAANIALQSYAGFLARVQILIKK